MEHGAEGNTAGRLELAACIFRISDCGFEIDEVLDSLSVFPDT
jgi:hypothetical protein